jgi:putative nucleotidyltransferase with HDIG domain
MAVDVNAAAELAEEHLARALPRRWKHVQAVAATAERVAPLVGDDGAVLIAAAWLHDIGYAPDLVDTGFHPLDGARFLRRVGFDDRLAALVAHHSCAVIEADERGLVDELSAEFTREHSPTTDALWYCDMITGPDGEPLPAWRRLEEIRIRYGPGHVVTRFVDRAEGDILRAVHRTGERLRAAELNP